jgi:hypothetical protein
MNQLIPELSIKKTAVVALSLALTVGWVPGYAINTDGAYCKHYDPIYGGGGKRSIKVGSCADLIMNVQSITKGLNLKTKGQKQELTQATKDAMDNCNKSYEQSGTCLKKDNTGFEAPYPLYKRCSWKNNRCMAIDGRYDNPREQK